MKQCYHTIFMQRSAGGFVGWVEEIRGTITSGQSLDECRRNLKDSLQLILQTYRDEARVPVGRGWSCIEESIEIGGFWQFSEPIRMVIPFSAALNAQFRNQRFTFVCWQTTKTINAL